MGTVYKNKNFIQKLAIPLTFIVTAGYELAYVYTYFIAFDFNVISNFNSWIKYLLWIVFEVVILFSSSANNMKELAGHIFRCFVCFALSVAVLWYWLENYCQPDETSEFYKQITMIYEIDFNEYKFNIFIDILKSSLGLTAFGAFICYAKLQGSTNGWIKKHTYK
ncbi:MAG: hypothetical protein ACI4I6_09960 [Hominimerdicola sp.]